MQKVAILTTAAFAVLCLILLSQPVNAAAVDNTFRTNPTKLPSGLSVDGTWYSDTTTITWYTGTLHNLTAIDVSFTGSGPYNFRDWEFPNGTIISTSQSILVTTPLSSTTFIANFTTTSSTSPSCGITSYFQLTKGCYLPAVINYYSIKLSLPVVMGILLGDINVAIFIKNKNALTVAFVFSVSCIVLNYAIPGPFLVITAVAIAGSIAGLFYKMLTQRG